MQAARDSLQRAQIFAEALQSRINVLSADFTARDDPAQRAVVANDRQKALAELTALSKELIEGDGECDFRLAGEFLFHGVADDRRRYGRAATSLAA